MNAWLGTLIYCRSTRAHKTENDIEIEIENETDIDLLETGFIIVSLASWRAFLPVCPQTTDTLRKCVEK